MAKNYNTAPYYDDYSDAKHYMRMLFHPARAVQSRELTQLQTIIQKQLERFGKHMFVEGSLVLGGETYLDAAHAYLKLEEEYSLQEIILDDFIGKTIVGLSSGAIANVITYAESDSADPKTLYIQYNSGDSSSTVVVTSAVSRTLYVSDTTKFIVGAKVEDAIGSNVPAGTVVVSINSTLGTVTINNAILGSVTSVTVTTSSEFDAGETIAILDTTASVPVTAKATTWASTPCGVGTVYTINTGVFFTQGLFVQNEKQTIVVSKYSSTASAKIGLYIQELTIESSDDQTLLDPARGFYNYNAPGADRYQINLILVAYETGETVPSAFIELERVENGIVQSKIVRTDYSDFEKTLARRTYDESGDYTVRDFSLEVREHLDTGTNHGVYPYGDEAKLALAIGAGKAYVRGFELESNTTSFVDINKGRDYAQVNSAQAVPGLGNFVYVDHVYGSPNISEYQEVLIMDDVNNGTDNTNGSNVGSARIRCFEYVSGTPGTPSAIYKAYLFDINMNSGKTFADDAKSIVYGSGTQMFLCDTVLDGSSLASINDAAKNNISVFRIPQSVVKTLRISGTPSTLLTVYRSYSATISSEAVTLTAGANETFVPYNGDTDYHLSLADGTVIDLSASGNGVTLGGTPTGTQVTFDLAGQSGVVYVVAKLIRTLTQEKTKTKTTVTETLSPDSNGDVLLSNADIFSVTSILSGATDVASRYVVDDGQRDNYYTNGRLVLKSGEADPGSVSVTYEYFAHGSGGYCTVDSYSGIDYGDIPTYTTSAGIEIALRDAFDFRPVILTTGLSIASDIFMPGDNISFDYQYYLGRVDALYLTEYGVFGISEGISADSPVSTAIPSNAMTLSTIYVPPYTFSATDVVLTKKNNKRYTMADIGHLETRIDNLEYYSTLSLLEADTSSLFFDDGTGSNRFKNGFVVDNFGTNLVGDIMHADYSAAVDISTQELRPSFLETSIALEIDESLSSGYDKTSDVISIAYNTTTLLTQPYASTSTSVNPFTTARWIGVIALSPSSDSYAEGVTRNLTSEVSDSGSSSYNYWWKRLIYPSLQKYNYKGNGWYVISIRGADYANLKFLSLQGISEYYDVTNPFQGAGGSMGRLLLVNPYNSLDETTEVSNDTTYMRSAEIAFSGTGFKPNTTLYPFFDGVDVSAYCAPSALQSDGHGNVNGIFTIPNNQTVRFKTGDKLFRLIDTSTGVTSSASTIGEAVYSSSANPSSSVSDIQSIKTPRKVSAADIKPLAQSFILDSEDGVYASGIDLYFSSKPSASVPVVVSIRNMENGEPGSYILPYSETSVASSSITTSADGSVATHIDFPGLVYLRSGIEYAVCITTVSSDYSIYAAAIGDTVINGTAIISKQPLSGTLFKPGNTNEYVSDLNMDIKLNIYGAAFDTSTPATVYLENSDLNAEPLQANPIKTANGSTSVIIYHPNCLNDGDYVVIAGVQAACNGIPAAEINGAHIVSNVSATTYTITATTPATDTGMVGGSGISAIVNAGINTLMLSSNEDLPSSCALAWYYKATNTRYDIDSSWQAITPNSVVELGLDRIVGSAQNETAFAGGNKTLQLKAEMSTTNPYVSPVIGLDATSVLGIRNRINDDVTGEDGVSGGMAEARYITKTISLDDPATALRIIFDGKSPVGTDFRVYYKISADDSASAITDESWVEMTATATVLKSPYYTEYQYFADDLPEFSLFKIKIVLTSPSYETVPKIQKFRAIAFAS